MPKRKIAVPKIVPANVRQRRMILLLMTLGVLILLVTSGVLFILSEGYQSEDLVALFISPTPSVTLTPTNTLTITRTLLPSNTTTLVGMPPTQIFAGDPALTPTPRPSNTITDTPDIPATKTFIAGLPTATKVRIPTRTRPPTRTLRPTRTQWPTRTPTITLTPTPTYTPIPPLAKLVIRKPGYLSKLISPVRMEMMVSPGEDGLIWVDLIGEDSRTIVRQSYNYSRYRGQQIWIGPSLEFNITAASELTRLVVSIQDIFGRRIALTSVEVVLFKVGENEITSQADTQAPYIIRFPKAEEEISGGVVAVTALVRPVNDTPVILELITEDGRIIGSSKVDVPDPSGDLSHTLFEVNISYTISERTPVRLTIRQESDNRIAGTVALFSQLIFLQP
jgi:hypothetical protein